ncbi:MAG: prolyl oligopeptidase family serine peptidase [Candidatus Methanofastidiosia archaeon]|jgi:dipeptidyl aminopeptidase/acylaminoacyl peptidase
MCVKKGCSVLLLTFLIICVLGSGCQNNNGEIVTQKLTEYDIPYGDQVECYQIEYISDGIVVPGFIVTPLSEGVYPVLIINRGGNREYEKIDEDFLVCLFYFASEGYCVIASQYRGLYGYEGHDEFGGEDVNDVLNLFYVIDQLEYADKDNVFMLGYSRGGMMTYLAIKNQAPIKAAAVVGGPTDLIQWYDERDYGLKRVLEELIGGTPRQMEEEYKKRSAYYWPEKITVPVLILHGENDTKVNATQAKKLGEKLEALKKEYELVIFAGDTHYIRLNRGERDEKILEWFSKYTVNLYLHLDRYIIIY